MSENLEIADVMRRIFINALTGVFVARPGKVESYDATKQTMSVRPVFKQTLQKREAVEVKDPPRLDNVPVCQPRGGGFFVSMPIQAGDYVLLVFADRALDTWLSSGKVSDPIDLRQHDINDAIAIPGVFPSASAVGDASGSNLVIGKDGGSLITIKGNGEIVLGAPETTTACPRDDKLQTNLTNIKADLAAIATAAGTTSNYTVSTTASDVVKVK